MVAFARIFKSLKKNQNEFLRFRSFDTKRQAHKNE